MSSDLIRTLRAIVRAELARLQPTELGIVTRVYGSEGDDTANHQVNVKLRSSGVELHRVPVAVSRLGISALPNEGDLVLLAFVGNDINAPVALGCVYDDESHPPSAQAHEVVYEPPDPEDGSLRRVQITLGNGTALTFGDEQLEVVMGATSLVLNRDGDVAVSTSGNVTFSADGDLELKSAGNLKITAQGNLTMKGTGTTLEASAEAKLKGAQVALAGNTQFSPA